MRLPRSGMEPNRALHVTAIQPAHARCSAARERGR